MVATLNWLVSAGVFALVVGFGFRELDAWRVRQRELKGLLYLLDLEVSYNQRTLSTFGTHPDYIIEPIGQPIRTAIWQDSRTRIAQLTKNKDHFRDIAIFYNNLEDVIRPAIETDAVSNETKQEFVTQLLPDMQAKAQEIRNIIHSYIEPPEEEFGLPVGSADDSRE